MVAQRRRRRRRAAGPDGCDLRDSTVMRVLVCPDKFAGTLSAPEAAAAIADGLARRGARRTS